MRSPSTRAESNLRTLACNGRWTNKTRTLQESAIFHPVHPPLTITIARDVGSTSERTRSVTSLQRSPSFTSLASLQRTPSFASLASL